MSDMSRAVLFNSFSTDTASLTRAKRDAQVNKALTRLLGFRSIG